MIIAADNLTASRHHSVRSGPDNRRDHGFVALALLRAAMPTPWRPPGSTLNARPHVPSSRRAETWAHGPESEPWSGGLRRPRLGVLDAADPAYPGAGPGLLGRGLPVLNMATA